MPRLYQNDSISPNRSTFVETGVRLGESVAFSASVANVKRNTVTVKMVSGKASYEKITPVKACDSECVVAEVSSGFAISFNVKYGDSAALADMKAEVLRLFSQAEANMVHGVVPGAAATFAEA